MLKAVFSRLAAVATVVLAVPVALSLLNRFASPFDAIAQFRVHLALLLAAAALVAALAGARKAAVTGGLVAIAALALTYPYVPDFGPGTRAAAAGVRTVRIVQFNTLYNNSRTELAARIIRDADPDVILLQEVTDNPTALINLLRADYPVQIRCDNSPIGGATVISRLPIAQDDTIACSHNSRFSAVRLNRDGHAITFASFHGTWPWPFGQSKTIAELAPQLSALPRPLVLAGDFNAVPWSEGVQRVARLTDTQPARGFRATWLTLHLPSALRAWIGLPIDQIMVSDEMKIVAVRTLPFAGSDHLPVVADIAF